MGEDKCRSCMLLNKMPQDIVEGVVFCALLGRDGSAAPEDDEDERRLILVSLRGSCRALREASSLRSIARRCISSPCVLTDLLLAQRRVLLHRFLRLSGGYPTAVRVFLEEIERMRELKPAVPLPIVATLCKLTGRLFTQISAYSEVLPYLVCLLRVEQVEGPAQAGFKGPSSASKWADEKSKVRAAFPPREISLSLSDRSLTVRSFRVSSRTGGGAPPEGSANRQAGARGASRAGRLNSPHLGGDAARLSERMPGKHAKRAQ